MLLVISVINVYSQALPQQTLKDSVLNVLKNGKEDTNKVKAINKMALELIVRGHYRIADSVVNKELDLAMHLNYKTGIANAYNDKGILCNYESDFLLSLKFLLKSLKIYEELNNKHGIGLSYKFIGAVYAHQSDTLNASLYYNKALSIFFELKDTNNIATTFLSKGRLAAKQGMNHVALNNFRTASILFSELNNKDGIASALLFSSVVYKEEGIYDSAKATVLRGKQIFEEIKDVDGISGSYHLLGLVSLANDKYEEALEYENKSLKLAYEISAKDCIMDAEGALSQIYEKKGDQNSALVHYKAFIKARDSIFNQESSLKTMNTELNYAREKKDAEMKAAEEKKITLENEEAARNRAILFLGVTILLVLIVFLIFVYRTNFERKKDNKIIEGKNYQITQSIGYAERIQRAMLPEIAEVHNMLPESFVLFKPKDIVSGDFYFVTPKDEKIVLAVADCTGHGVPGGFMSMLCSEKLNDIVYQTWNTGEILTQLNKGVKTSLRQTEGEDSTYDGMDIGLCLIQKTVNGMKISFSGALRPLWIIRKDASEIEEISPTPYTIGGFTTFDQEYGTYILQLNKGDTFYLFTDGYIDQFGGESDRKFGLGRFRDLLLGIHKMPMAKQQNELESRIEGWQGENLQLDDMLIVGVKV